MTTDQDPRPSPDDATRARIEALRQRRAGSAAAEQPAPGPDRKSRARAAPTSKRRKHAAAGARILAGGLSATVALGLMSVMAGAEPGTAAAPSPTSPVPAPEPIVIVVRSSTDPNVTPADTNVAAVPAATSSPAPAVAPTAAPPVASSEAS
ncbi:MAG: hypothetical protein S0880_15780 [Actinomycetota bacterium]|nr:hypothetical protein [Actinomycetota bacterium]